MEYLSITTLGLNQAESINIIVDIVIKYECNIVRSHMQKLASDFAITMLVCGSWNSIAKLESALQNLSSNLNIAIATKRSAITTSQTHSIPYHVQVIGIGDSTLIYEIIAFFYSQSLSIEDLHVETTARTSDTTITTLNGLVHIPTDISIANLREQYLSLCDEFNVDGILEPKCCN